MEFIPFRAKDKVNKDSKIIKDSNDHKNNKVNKNVSDQQNISNTSKDYEFIKNVPKKIKWNHISKHSIINKYNLIKTKEEEYIEYYHDRISDTNYKLYKNNPNVFIPIN